MKSIIKVVLLFLFVVTNIQAKISQGQIEDGLFDSRWYQGNVVNNKFTEEVKIFCKRDNSSINYYINYVNDVPISGTFHSCENEKLKNEIKYGIHSKKDLKPIYDYSLKGKFNSNAKKEDDLLTNGMDAIMKFYNTNSYDILKGKYYKIDGDEYIKGTLYLKNNIIKEITATFDIKKMTFYKDEIEIKTEKLTFKGEVTNTRGDINKFDFDGAIIWNNSGCKEIKSGTFVEESLIDFENGECKNLNKMKNVNTNNNSNKEYIKPAEKNEVLMKKQDYNIKIEKDIKLEKVESNKNETINLEK